MGAVDIITFGEGTNYKDVFNQLVQEAIYEYGNDSYNGTISTCRIGNYSCEKFADVYSPSIEKKAYKIARDRIDDMAKCDCEAFDLGVIRYEIIKVKKSLPKINKVAIYKQQYAVIKIDGNGKESVVKSFETKKIADDYAVKLAFANVGKNMETYFVAKRPVNINNGNDKVTEFKLEIKKQKSKPKTVPKGCIVNEIHRYLFYGLAAE